MYGARMNFNSLTRFLAATKRLYMHLFGSIGPSVRQLVSPSVVVVVVVARWNLSWFFVGLSLASRCCRSRGSSLQHFTMG